MREVKWWNLAPTSWHKFVSWGLGGFSHQISERSYHTHDLELIRKKEESNGQGPRLPRSRPPSSKLYVQEDFIHWLETPMYKWLFPGCVRCIEQWEMYVRILGAWLRRVDCIETKAEFRDLGTKVWEQMERNFASGATPKMIDLWIPKSSLSMAGKWCSVQGNHSPALHLAQVLGFLSALFEDQGGSSQDSCHTWLWIIQTGLQ